MATAHLLFRIYFVEHAHSMGAHSSAQHSGLRYKANQAHTLVAGNRPLRCLYLERGVWRAAGNRLPVNAATGRKEPPEVSKPLSWEACSQRRTAGDVIGVSASYRHPLPSVPQSCKTRPFMQGRARAQQNGKSLASWGSKSSQELPSSTRGNRAGVTEVSV